MTERSVTDERGRTITLAPEPVGAGGQGEVYRSVDQPDLAVKILLGGDGPAPVEPRALLARLTRPSARAPLPNEDRPRLRMARKLSLLRTLPLPEDLQVAQPLAMLQSHVGYTMRLLRDMTPWLSLIVPPGGDVVTTYVATGGLRRRLVLLGKLATLLARLHGLSIAYGDLSPKNVFVSAASGRSEVWLIDADNLAFSTDQAPGVYTDGFGAPELIRAGGVITTLADSWSFAVLAFWTLTAAHPFLGERVVEGDGWDATVSRPVEERAFAGELPFVLDADDTSNVAAIPLVEARKVLSPGLLALFRQCFGPGRGDATARPTMTTWVEALERAADHALTCPACGASAYGADVCRWCDAGLTPEYLDVEVWRYEPELDAPGEVPTTPVLRVMRAGFDVGEKVIIPRRLVAPTGLVGRDAPALELEPLADGFRLRALDDRRYGVVLPDRRRLEPLGRERVLPDARPGREWWVHTGDLDTPHRVLSFRHLRSTRGGGR